MRVTLPSVTRCCSDRRIAVGAHTFLYVETRNNSAQLEHEATTSKISVDKLFYCCQHGISEDGAISMIVNGFCKYVFSELPLEIRRRST